MRETIWEIRRQIECETTVSDETAASIRDFLHELGDAFYKPGGVVETRYGSQIAGAADLSIALDTLTGDLQFTQLEHWSTGQAPGAVGTGAVWTNASLSYDVEVRGNTFVRTAGDEGILTGAFLGTAHQAMGGSLQREDLSAAFGGKR